MTTEGLDLFLDASAHAPDLPAGAPFAPWRLRILPPDEFEALAGKGGRDLQLAYLAAFGLLAPSTHNTVPERFALRGGDLAIDLVLDRSLVLPESDRAGRQAVLSVGCCAANLGLAARAYGWACEIASAGAAKEDVAPLAGSGPRLVRLASACFRPGAGAPDPSFLAPMLARKVVRARFDERVELDPAARQELAAAAGRAGPGVALHLLTDFPTLLFLGKFQEAADATVINRDGFARELGDWLLPNDDPSARGMRGREHGLADDAARHVHRGLRHEERLLPDEIAALAKAGGTGMRSSSAVAVLAIAWDDVPDWLAAGSAYEEMALLLHRRGLRTAMHAAIAEVEAPNLALRARLRTGDRPVAVFRIGRPLEKQHDERPHSSRPALSSVLL